MKKLFILCLIAIWSQSCIVSSRPNMDFAKHIKRPKGTHVVAVNPPVFLAKPFIERAIKEDDESAETLKLIRKIKKVRVMCIAMDSTVDNMGYVKTMSERMDVFLHKNQYEEYATIRNKGQKVAIHARQDGDIIKDLMIQTISPKDGAVYVYVKARISPEDLSNLINMASDKN